MKKINKTLSKSYITARIFLDELRHIEELIGDKQNYILKTKDYEFKNIEELINKYNNQKLNELKISSYNPYITIEFDKMGVELYCGSDDTESSGIFYKLDSIISSSSRKLNFIYSYDTFYTIFCLYLVYLFTDIILFLNTIDTNTYNNNFFKVVRMILSALYTFYTLWFLYIRRYKSIEIIVSEKKDMQSFLSKNKDSIISGIIISLIASFITYLIVYTFKNIFS